jgi:hypothetical protein
MGLLSACGDGIERVYKSEILYLDFLYKCLQMFASKVFAGARDGT